MSESELEYRSGALKLEHGLHNIGHTVLNGLRRVRMSTTETYCTEIRSERSYRINRIFIAFVSFEEIEAHFRHRVHIFLYNSHCAHFIRNVPRAIE